MTVGRLVLPALDRVWRWSAAVPDATLRPSRQTRLHQGSIGTARLTGQGATFPGRQSPQGHIPGRASSQFYSLAHSFLLHPPPTASTALHTRSLYKSTRLVATVTHLKPHKLRLCCAHCTLVDQAACFLTNIPPSTRPSLSIHHSLSRAQSLPTHPQSIKSSVESLSTALANFHKHQQHQNKPSQPRIPRSSAPAFQSSLQ